jgi:glycosyltransferase involved in cell wall biosynthesis
LRVLHVVASYLPATRYGGPIVSVHGLARAQAALGLDVSVLTTSVDGISDSDVLHEQAVLLDGVKVYYFRSRFLRRLYFSWRMFRWLKAHINQFDVLHLHAVFLYPMTMAARVAWCAQKPCVIAPRGMLVPELFAHRSAWIKRAWMALFDHATIKRAKAFHATSELEIADALRLGVSVTNPVVIANGVLSPSELDLSSVSPDRRDLSSVSPDRRDLSSVSPDRRDLSSVSPDRRDLCDVDLKARPCEQAYILYLGRLSEKKRIELLLEALAKVPDLHLIIAGVDELGNRVRLERLAQALNISHRVQFLGELGVVAKWPWLAHARALALVSINENFGNAVAESLAVGRPVIVSSGVGLAQAVQRFNLGWIADNVEQLVQAMQAASLDNGALIEKATNARAYALHELSWSAIAQQSISLYRSIAPHAHV